MSRYHVVYDFSVMREDFLIVGIYSMEADASSHVAELKKAGSKSCASVPLEHAELVHRLTEERIGAIAEAIKGLVP